MSFIATEAGNDGHLSNLEAFNRPMEFSTSSNTGYNLYSSGYDEDASGVDSQSTIC